MKVVWTPVAEGQLRAIHGYLSLTSALRAKRIVDRITMRSKQIAMYPNSGRKVPEVGLPQIREVIEAPYRIIYRIKPGQIDIIAVMHGAMKAPWSG